MPSPLQEWRRGIGWPSANAGLVTLIVCGVFMPTSERGVLPFVQTLRPRSTMARAVLAT